MKHALFTLFAAFIFSQTSAQKTLYNDSLLICSAKKTHISVTYQKDLFQLFIDNSRMIPIEGNKASVVTDSIEKYAKENCSESPGSLAKNLGNMRKLISDRMKMETDIVRSERLNSSMIIVEKLDANAHYKTIIVTDGADINLVKYVAGKYVFDLTELQKNDAAVHEIAQIVQFLSKNTDTKTTCCLTDVEGKSYLIFDPKIEDGKVTGTNRLKISAADADTYRGKLIGTTADDKKSNVYAAKIDEPKDDTGEAAQSTADEDNADDDGDYSAEKTDILLLTAYNFDFTSTVKSNYVGMLNIRSTNIGGTRWAINGGFTKINYSLGDYAKDSSGQRVIENVRQNPLDTATTGYTYYRQLNQYSIKKTTNSWSLFGQVLFEITNKTKHKIFAHAHTELFISKYTTNTEISTLYQDTLVATAATHDVIRSNIMGNSLTSSFTSLDGYFGLGGTGLFNFSSNTTLFVQPTFGWVVFGTKVDGSSFNQAYYAGNYRPNRKAVAPFYLVKFSLSQKISDKNSAIVVGSEIRGYLPNKIPQFAIYGGLTIDFADLAKFF